MNTPHKPIIDRAARKARGESLGQMARRIGMTVTELSELENGNYDSVVKQMGKDSAKRILFPSAEPARIVDGAGRPLWVDLSKPKVGIKMPKRTGPGLADGEEYCSGTVTGGYIFPTTKDAARFKEVLGYPVDEVEMAPPAQMLEFGKPSRVAIPMVKSVENGKNVLRCKDPKDAEFVQAIFGGAAQCGKTKLMQDVREFEAQEKARIEKNREKFRTGDHRTFKTPAQKAINKKRRSIAKLQARWDNIRAYWTAKMESEHKELAKLQE